MRIAYLVQQFPPEVGAGPARVQEMSTRWIAAGDEVTVVTAMPNRPQGMIHPAYRRKLFVEEDWNGIRVLRSWLYTSPVYSTGRTVLNNASFMTTAIMHALGRLGQPDVLVASSPPFFPHIAGDIIATAKSIPLVLELRDLWPDYLVGMGMFRAESLAAKGLFRTERRLLQRAERAVVVTGSFKHRVRLKGVHPDRISVIPNGVDSGAYYPATEPPPISALQRRFDEFIVGYLGNFGAGQALESLVDAAALLSDADPPIKFVFAGDGPQRQQVVDRAAALKLPNLEIHPAIPKDQTRAFYNACDLCLVPLAPLPILQETVPSKIFEIMACERPLIACVAGETAAIVERSGCGLVCTPGDALALAQAIRSTAAMPADERAEWGRRGGEFARGNYSRDVLAERYRLLLSKVARDGRRAPKESVSNPPPRAPGIST